MSAFDLLAASIGLAVSALAAALLLPLWRRAPVPAYRLVVSVLAAALALPLLQWAARALDLPVPHPARDLALALGAGLPERLDPAFASRTLELALPPLEEPEVQETSSFAPAQQVLAAPSAAPLATLAEPPRAQRPWPWSKLLLAGWAAGALWALGRTARRLYATQRLFARARPVVDAARIAVWEAVRAGSRTGARTRLCESTEVRTPACAGLLRPAVVLPADDSLADRPELLACVLTHELVHLERRDPWVLFGEELLRAAFWFHPAAWWLVARLGALRELSCDCLVVRRTGKRKRYASALVEYATWMQQPAPRASWAAVVPWSESRGHLTRRIEMLLQPQTDTKTGRIVAPAAVGVLMTFLWSGQLALATSSCAGTRSDHEHEHAQAHDEEATCAGEPCEVQVVTHDGKQLVITTTRDGEPVAAPVAVTVEGKPLVYRVHTKSVQEGDGGDEKHVERCVVVLTDGEGEPQVLRGAEAKAWIEEHGVQVDKAHSKQALAEEIHGAWLGAKGGEQEVIVLDGKKLERTTKDGEAIEVIVVGPDGAKRVHGKKAGDPFVQPGQAAFPRLEYRFRIDSEAQAQGQAADAWTFQLQPDGKKVKGHFAPQAAKTFRLELGYGDGDTHGKVQGDVHGGVHGDVQGETHGGVHGDVNGQGHGFFGTTPQQGFFGAQSAETDLDALRQELEKTRAALEEQRRMLEELRQQIQKQREKADSVGVWTK